MCNLGLAEDTSDASIACRQTGYITLTEDIIKDKKFEDLKFEEEWQRHKKPTSKESKELHQNWKDYYKNKSKHIKNSEWYKHLKKSYNTIKSFEKDINNKYGNIFKEKGSYWYYEEVDYYDTDSCEYLNVKRDSKGNETYDYEEVNTPRGAYPISDVNYDVNPLLFNSKLRAEFNKIRKSRTGIKNLENEIKKFSKEIEKDNSLSM